MSIKDNCDRVRENIASAAIKCGRKPEDVELIAVTKFVDTDRIYEAVAAGIGSVGENRPQELVEKLDFFNENELNVHLIGQLQTNKVKYVIGKVRLIQSVDRLALAQTISRLACANDLVQDVLIEVNIGSEEQKGGIGVMELPDFLSEISLMPGIHVKGLMCIPPAVEEEEARGYFAAMRKLFDRIGCSDIPNVDMEQLSMGMSGDYMAAVSEGATMVRVGTALFGARR